MNELHLVDLGDVMQHTRESGPPIRIENLAGDLGYD